jgi:hypothetical protein
MEKEVLQNKEILPNSRNQSKLEVEMECISACTTASILLGSMGVFSGITFGLAGDLVKTCATGAQTFNVIGKSFFLLFLCVFCTYPYHDFSKFVYFSSR